MTDEPWNPTNPEWWKVNVEARPPEVVWQWLANEYQAVVVTPERLADVLFRLGFDIFNTELRSYPDLDQAARTIVWALAQPQEDHP